MFLCTFLHPESGSFRPSLSERSDAPTGELLYACPRATLEKVLKQLESKLGFTAWAGMEVKPSLLAIPHLKGRLQYEYFQFSETPQSAADKNFRNLVPFTPGNHGYSLLRTQLNKDYFHEIYTEVGS
jgi:glutamine synthetase